MFEHLGIKSDDTIDLEYLSGQSRYVLEQAAEHLAQLIVYQWLFEFAGLKPQPTVGKRGLRHKTHHYQ